MPNDLLTVSGQITSASNTHAASNGATSAKPAVRPSLFDPSSGDGNAVDLELKRFAKWTTDPLWVPPKDTSREMAETMFRQTRVMDSAEKKWQRVVASHRNDFTQVREIELFKSSIRLPQGRLFVSVTEQQNFDKITDDVPASVKTRLQEFLDGPGKRDGVRVYYLKPLCVEVENQLVFTPREVIDTAIDQIRTEVFSNYRRMLPWRLTKRSSLLAMNAALSIPRRVAAYALKSKRRAVETFEAKLEFRRRQTALDAAKEFGRYHRDACSFDEMLDLTMPLRRDAVIRQFCVQHEITMAKQKAMLREAAGQLPWFAALSTMAVGAAYIYSIAKTVTLVAAPPVVMCDPAFVAEMPNERGVLLNIGHFDDVDGVRHIEF